MPLLVPKPGWPFSINYDSPQAEGLLSWWPGEPVGSKLFDLTQNKMHARFFGTQVAGKGLWSPGQDNGRNALKFISASSTYADTGSAVWADNLPVMSVSCWVRTVENVWCTWFGKISDVLNSAGWNIGQYFSGPGLTIQDNGGNNGIFAFGNGPDLTFLDGRWHHVVGVLYGLTIGGEFYLDGVSVSAVGVTGTISSYSNAINLQLGRQNSAGGGSGGTARVQYCNAQIEDVRIYNRALSVDEVRAMYEPKTRWELRYVPKRRLFSAPIVASSVHPWWQYAGPMMGSLSGGSINV